MNFLQHRDFSDWESWYLSLKAAQTTPFAQQIVYKMQAGL